MLHWQREKVFSPGMLGLVIATLAMPTVLPWATAAEMLTYAIAAMAANLLIGFGGLVSFGQAAFFGAGGYVAGYVMREFAIPLCLALPLAMLAGGAVAAVVGALTVKRQGIYFMMLTFAWGELFYYLAYQLDEFTGGEDGMIGIPRPRFDLGGLSIDFGLDNAYYWIVAGLFLASFLAMQRTIDSPLGLVLQAARDNARRAKAVGYDVSRVQVIVFVISGAFTGLAGSLYAMVYRIMPLDTINWHASGYFVFMVLVGGTRSLYGSVIGAVLFIVLQDLLSLYWARWPLMFGILIVATAMYLRGGVLELLDRAMRLIPKAAPATGKRQNLPGVE